jgi:hypothetical protein
MIFWKCNFDCGEDAERRVCVAIDGKTLSYREGLLM